MSGIQLAGRIAVWSFFGLILVVMAISVTALYQSSDPAMRRQMRWMGLAVLILTPALTLAVQASRGDFG